MGVWPRFALSSVRTYNFINNIQYCSLIVCGYEFWSFGWERDAEKTFTPRREKVSGGENYTTTSFIGSMFDELLLWWWDQGDDMGSRSSTNGEKYIKTAVGNLKCRQQLKLRRSHSVSSDQEAAAFHGNCRFTVVVPTTARHYPLRRASRIHFLLQFNIIGHLMIQHATAR